MRKLLLAGILFIYGTHFAQDKKIQFSKIITYELSEEIKEKGEIPNMQLFASNEGEFLTAIDISYLPFKLYSDQVGTFPVSIALGSKLKFNSLSPYFGRRLNLEKEKINSKVEKLKTTQNIAGLSCNNYQLTSWRPNEIFEEGKKIQLCINENNAVNNVPVFAGIFNEMEGTNFMNMNVKGLILSIGQSAGNSKEFMRLKSIKNTSEYAIIDARKQRINQKSQMDSLMAIYKLEEDNYEKAYAADTVAIATDVATAVIDSADYYDSPPPPPSRYSDRYEDMYIPEYQSLYKKKPEYTNYAIDSIEEEKIWGSLPKHCRKVDQDLPTLENKEYAQHLKNFTGQMCDLYLSQLEINSVAVKATVDDVRRELLYFNEYKEKLSKSDRKKVDRYWKKLD